MLNRRSFFKTLAGGGVVAFYPEKIKAIVEFLKPKVPVYDLYVKKTTIVPRARKLKKTWTLETPTEFNIQYSVGAEKELIKILT